MPYHLAYFNQVMIDGIGKDNGQSTKSSWNELNEWNNSYFARRSTDQLGSKGLDYFKSTQQTIRDTAEKNKPDISVFLPLLFVGGWRTLTFALEYILDHTWTHFTETYLRFHNRLPDLPAKLVHRSLDFSMNVVSDILVPKDLENVQLVTTLKLTGSGGGTWTFIMRDGKSTVKPEEVENPDSVITTDLATYLKTNLYGMENPLMALLTGRTKIMGAKKAQQFQKLFAVTPQRIWKLSEFGVQAPNK